MTEQEIENQMYDLAKGKVSSCHADDVLIEYGEYICGSCDRICVPVKKSSPK